MKGEVNSFKRQNWRQMIKILTQGEYPETAGCTHSAGGAGAVCLTRGEVFLCPARRNEALDTTGAKDTFGYFLAALTDGRKLRRCLEGGGPAAAIAVSRLRGFGFHS